MYTNAVTIPNILKKTAKFHVTYQGLKFKFGYVWFLCDLTVSNISILQPDGDINILIWLHSKVTKT